jgi:predicted dehydrogenase
MTGITRVGVIGISEGNGHPFSFSAIINGYSDQGLVQSGWKVIYDYVRRRDPSEFGIDGLRVTHAWTQDEDITRRLCKACLISNAVSKPEDMIGEVDAVILARDDYENHFRMALPFLEAGLHVFVDKPMSLDVAELKAFKPYLERGRLFSCSGMRYAKELDEPRSMLSEYGKIKLVRGAVLNDWEKYGVHLLYAIFGLVTSKPVAVLSPGAGHASVTIKMDDGSLVQIDSLGDCPKTFRIDLWGTKCISSHEILDNFTMFRRMLWHFSESIKNGQPAIPVLDNLEIMRILIAGRTAQAEERKVLLDEIEI